MVGLFAYLEMGKITMSETTATSTETVETTEPATVASDGPIQLPDDHPLVKTLAAQKEALRELRTKAQKFDELEEAKKTELQKAQERAEAAEAALSKSALEAARATVALNKGLTESQAKRLVGSTREELEADADVLIADLQLAAAKTPKAPSADGQGAVGETVTGSDDGLDEAIAAAQKARNFPLVATLKQQKAAKKG